MFCLNKQSNKFYDLIFFLHVSTVFVAFLILYGSDKHDGAFFFVVNNATLLKKKNEKEILLIFDVMFYIMNYHYYMT